jgi:hypothetical protein
VREAKARQRLFLSRVDGIVPFDTGKWTDTPRQHSAAKLTLAMTHR